MATIKEKMQQIAVSARRTRNASGTRRSRTGSEKVHERWRTGLCIWPRHVYDAGLRMDLLTLNTGAIYKYLEDASDWDNHNNSYDFYARYLSLEAPLEVALSLLTQANDTLDETSLNEIAGRQGAISLALKNLAYVIEREFA
jgi:hypothetical protein